MLRQETSSDSQDEDDMAGIKKLVVGVADLLDAEDGGDCLCDASDQAGYFPTRAQQLPRSDCFVSKQKILITFVLTLGSIW